MNRPHTSRFGLERDGLHSFWIETHAVPTQHNAPPFLLVGHRYHSGERAPGGNKNYDLNSIREYGGTFKELTANTHEAMLAAFQELRGWPVSE